MRSIVTGFAPATAGGAPVATCAKAGIDAPAIANAVTTIIRVLNVMPTPPFSSSLSAQ
ncbi:hypothetical protein IL54_2331 [Sphingobium sp. ba1]|nr:hypothetical protein IL54_2331 [Sphingobium sp. ba1]